ncbi:MAG: hypothetical protein CL910_14060 [Deltaproteobacteria bacterium]|nr:hypothetical protein [Deltaproteobacteria bacterium]
MLTQPLLHQFIDRIHASAIESEFPVALARDLSKELGGAFIAVSRFHRFPVEVGQQTISRPLGPYEESWLEDHSQELPWADMMAGDASGRFFEVGEYFGEEQIRATRYFREWMQPQGFAPLAVMGSSHPPTDEVPGSGWALYRDRDFDAEEVEFCRVLDTQLARAAQTAWHLHMARAARDAALEVLDSGIEGILLINPNGLVTWRNRRAVDLLAREPALRVEAGRLRSSIASVDTALAAALSGATDPNEAGTPTVVSVPRGRGELPLGIALVPVARPLPDLRGNEPAALAFLVDTTAVRRPAVGLLEALYGLTPAEGRLARALAGGQTPASFAETTGRSPETVRTQLKFLFRKLKVSRQSELIRLLATTPASNLRD